MSHSHIALRLPASQPAGGAKRRTDQAPLNRATTMAISCPRDLVVDARRILLCYFRSLFILLIMDFLVEADRNRPAVNSNTAPVRAASVNCGVLVFV